MTRDDRGCHPLRKMRDQKFFRCVAYADGIVDDANLAADQLEYMRGRDIGQIKGRLLPHRSTLKSVKSCVSSGPRAHFPCRSFRPLPRAVTRAPAASYEQQARRSVMEKPITAVNRRARKFQRVLSFSWLAARAGPFAKRRVEALCIYRNLVHCPVDCARRVSILLGRRQGIRSPHEGAARWVQELTPRSRIWASWGRPQWS